MQTPCCLAPWRRCGVVFLLGLAAVAGDRVYAGTDAGIALAGPDGTFTPLGFVDGLPGRAVYELFVADDGQVWARSDDGVARLLP